jgi:hypothetical protein
MSNSQVNPIFSTILATMSGGPIVTPELAAMVDQLGALDSQIKALTKQADILKAAIKAHGPERYTGFIYEALVYESEGRTTTDWRSIAETFELTDDLIKAHTLQSKPTKSIKVDKI